MFDKYRKTGFERTLFYNYDMVLYTECPKSYRKFVLHLLKNRFAFIIKQMQYRFAVTFGTLSIYLSVRRPQPV